MSINLLNSLGLDSEEWLTYYQRLKAASSLSAIVWAACEMCLWMARCLVEQELEHRAQAPSTDGVASLSSLWTSAAQ